MEKTDTVFFDGRWLGSAVWDGVRDYSVPEAALRAGDNTLVVRLLKRAGGFLSPPDQLKECSK